MPGIVQEERPFLLSIQCNDEEGVASEVTEHLLYGYSISDTMAGLFGLGKIWEHVPKGSRIVMIKLEEYHV